MCKVISLCFSAFFSQVTNPLIRGLFFVKCIIFFSPIDDPFEKEGGNEKGKVVSPESILILFLLLEV